MLSIINYHYLRPSFKADYPSIYGMTPIECKKQLQLLRNEGEFLKIKDFNANYEAILKSEDLYYLITFDDGLKEQYVYGNSIMDDLGLEGYFFLNAMNFKDKKVSMVHKIHLLRSILAPHVLLDFLNKNLQYDFSREHKERSQQIYRFDDKESAALKYSLNFLIPTETKEVIINKLFANHFNEEEVNEGLYMTEDQIKSLSSKNMLGNHTYSHKNLGKLNVEELQFEIASSKKYLEYLTQASINAISYPYGTEEVYSDEVLEVTKRTSHKFGFTVKKGVNTEADNLLLLKRFDCNDLIGGKNYES
jgi:peptidoglycan/xylan/chitin deacetylase (PgdA/CDA1 family)